MKPYQQSVQDVLTEYDTNEQQGLSPEEVKKRRRQYGLNILQEKPKESWLWVFIKQFKSPLIYILLVAAAIIFFVGQDPLDAFIISGILFFNAIIGTIQEGRTRSILHSLKRFIVANTIVIRDDKKQLIENKYLVPGDIIILQEGGRVPADARIIESNNMQVNEAMLTGESVPVRKDTASIEQEMVVGDQRNMLFNGTYLLSGSGLAVVTATGPNTEIGKIHATVQEIQTDMPLRQELDRLSYLILLFVLGICIVLFLVGVLEGRPLQELLIMLTALFICVVPEGLPVVLTLVLVSGVYRMAKHNVLVKNMQAVEGLGRTDVIVIDKTGTLTRNEMMVTRLMAGDSEFFVSGQGYNVEGEVLDKKKQPVSLVQEQTLQQLGIACSLLNTATITPLPENGLFDIKGDPTEAALYVLSEKLGLNREQLEQQYKKIYEIPFGSDYKYHAGFYEKNGQGIAFIIGSPEVIMARAATLPKNVERILTNFLADGFRVVAVAEKKIDIATVDVDIEQQNDTTRTLFKNFVTDDLQFLGLCGIEDAIRKEVAPIIKQARDAGLRVIMATGDHEKTALYVAKEVGIFHKGDKSIDGPEFEQATDGQLLANLHKLKVFSRVSPTHKIRIIKLFHNQRKIVAMTGDGINDAPSLVAADLGIAMGRIGTEVAKQASDIVLLDDSFNSIISAIEQGRHIFYTLKRVVLYFFATNMGEIFIVLFALALNMKLPLTAPQILWLNLVTDGFLDVALSTEPKEEGLLRKSWLGQKLRLVDISVIIKMLWMAIPMGFVSLLVFWYYQANLAHARTMTLITMAMFQWFNAWNCRSDTKSIFQLGLFANKWLLAATALVFVLQIAVVYIPVMQYIFKTVSITFEQWLLGIGLASSILFLDEGRKLIVRYWWSD